MNCPVAETAGRLTWIAMTNAVALIPARGGSKAIEGKNLEQVGGKTLLQRSIEHASGTNGICGVYVSTDDVEIAAEARRCGAQVIERPAELATDTSSTEDAIGHAIATWRAQGTKVDAIVLLQCTSPFRENGQLQRALEKFQETGCDSMLSATLFHGFVWKPNRDRTGFRALTYDPKARPRRQDIDDTFCENGSFYIFRPTLFERTRSRLGGYVELFCVPQSEALEIDTPEDLMLARLRAQPDGGLQASISERPKWLIMMVEGTVTDGSVYWGDEGQQLVRFHSEDATAIKRWREQGGKVAWISRETNLAVELRAEALGVDYVATGVERPAMVIGDFVRKNKIEWGEVGILFGQPSDTVLTSMGFGHTATLASVLASVRHVVSTRAIDEVCTKSGGTGVVAEWIERLLPQGGQKKGEAGRCAA